MRPARAFTRYRSYEMCGLVAKRVTVSRQALRKLLDRDRFVFYPKGRGNDRWCELAVSDAGRSFGTLPALKKRWRPRSRELEPRLF